MPGRLLKAAMRRAPGPPQPPEAARESDRGMTRAGQIRAPRRQNPKGLAVIVYYAGHAADAENVVQEIRAAGGRAVAVKADVSVPAEVAAVETLTNIFAKELRGERCGSWPNGDRSVLQRQNP